MYNLVIALSINPRPLSALELKLSGLIMVSWANTVGDNQNAHVVTSNYKGSAINQKYGHMIVLLLLHL